MLEAVLALTQGIRTLHKDLPASDDSNTHSCFQYV
jgi:hypothetical protein